MKADIGHVLPQGVTKSDALFMVKQASTVSLQIAPVDLAGGRLTGPSSLQIYQPQTPQRLAWSRDGKSVAYVVRPTDDTAFIEIRNVSGDVRQLHPPLVYIPHLQWFPDGRALLVHGRDNKRRFMTLRIEVESGKQTMIAPDISDALQLTPDGNTAYYVLGDGGGGRAGTVMELDLATGARRTLFRKAEGTGAATLAPDGRFMAMVRTADPDRPDAAPASTLLLQPVDGGAPRQITVPADLEAFYGLDWSSDGSAVIVAARSPELALWQVPIDGTLPRKLDIDIRTWVTPYGIRVAPGSTRIAYFTGEDTKEVWALDSFVSRLPR
jgi:hypothetical protein